VAVKKFAVVGFQMTYWLSFRLGSSFTIPFSVSIEGT